MKNTETKIKYFLYARKSSESEDRQVQSIDDQISRLKTLANSLNISIKEIITESKSAKKPSNRPLFDEMLQRIENGEAQGILCWQINRLSRNPIDSGRVAWMLQQGVLHSIQTIDKEYRPEDNVLLFSVETGMANQFIIDLKKTSRRGMEGKAERGWLPSRAPIGYLNDKLEHTIVEDPDRFNLVRKMWDMMLTGSYTPPKILEIATNEWGLRTPKWVRSGNKEISKSGIYNMFSNFFYTGGFDWAGTRYSKGNHKAMITLEEYDRVQVLLGKKGRPRPQTHNHAYTGEIQCGECGCMHTASTKVKTIISTGNQKSFTYYYCTRRKKGITCTQKKTLTEKELECQIEKYLEESEINPKFLQWALDYLNERNDTEIEDRTKIYQSQQENLNKTQRELDNLTRMFYRELIDEAQFIKQRDELREKVARAKNILEETEDRASRWLELTQQTFEFATYARKYFLNPDTDPTTKKEILLGLGWNHTIKNQILSITKHKWLETIESGYKPLKSRYDALELDKTLTAKARNAQIEDIRTTWGGYWELNPD